MVATSYGFGIWRQKFSTNRMRNQIENCGSIYSLLHANWQAPTPDPHKPTLTSSVHFPFVQSHYLCTVVQCLETFSQEALTRSKNDILLTALGLGLGWHLSMMFWRFWCLPVLFRVAAAGRALLPATQISFLLLVHLAFLWFRIQTQKKRPKPNC